MADWFPVALIVVAYLVLHALASTLTPGAHVQPQLGFDEWVFGGTAPTVRLQRALWHPGDPHWYDYLATLVYLSHFVVSLTVGILLWLRAYPLFRRFRVLFITVTFAGFVTYVVYPAIPPWLASRRGDMPHAVRAVIDEALAAKESGEERVILFNYSGHGLLDLSAYDDYLHGRLIDA